MTNRTRTLTLDTIRNRIFKAAQYLSIKDAWEVAEYYKSIERDSDYTVCELEQLAEYTEMQAKLYRRM